VPPESVTTFARPVVVARSSVPPLTVTAGAQGRDVVGDERALADEDIVLEGVQAVEAQRTVGILGQAGGAAERGGDDAGARGEQADVEIAAGQLAAADGHEVGDGLAAAFSVPPVATLTVLRPRPSRCRR
jgi:hypothetical protein